MSDYMSISSYGRDSRYKYNNDGNGYISKLPPDSGKKKLKSDVVFKLSCDSRIPEPEVVQQVINVSLEFILAFLPDYIKNPLSLSDRKFKPLNNEITIRVGELKKDVKTIYGIDLDKSNEYSNIALDGLILTAKKSKDGSKGLVTIFIDYNKMAERDKEFGLAAWVAAITHEICGHLPFVLENKIPANKCREEYLAYKKSNVVFENIIANLEKSGKIDAKVIEKFKKQLEKEKELEKYYESLSS